MNYQLESSQVWNKQQVQQIVDEIPEGKQKVYLMTKEYYYAVGENKNGDYTVKKFKKLN